MNYQTINPYTEETIKTFPTINESRLEHIISVAYSCFDTWKQVSFTERAAIANKAIMLLRNNVDEFAHLITLEMGKLLSEARGEVLLSADIIEYYAQNAEQLLAPINLKQRSGIAYIKNEALGVLLGVQPWNFPFYQLARFAAPNLMAGNVVMIKHASCVPQCAIAFEKLWLDAGAPKGAYTNLLISHDQTKQLIDDPRIKGVALTGSVEAGKKVAEQAGKSMKKSTMELGGNDAFIVLEDADLEQTVKWAVWAKMNNTGQCCVAAKRFILVESIADQFLEKFNNALSDLNAGNPTDPMTTLAPLSTKEALEKLLGQIKQALAYGAKLILGGNQINRLGYFMQPTILINITPENPAFREEFFGPVALIFRVKNEEEAIALANHSDFGLGGSVFTQNEKKGEQIANGVNTGMIFINQATWTAADLPFGGVQNSGYGRELSSLGIQEFVNKKLIRIVPYDTDPD